MADKDFDQTDSSVLINSHVPFCLRWGFEFDASECEQWLLLRASCHLIQRAKFEILNNLGLIKKIKTKSFKGTLELDLFILDHAVKEKQNYKRKVFEKW